MLNVEAKSMGLPLVTYRPEGIYTDYTGSFPEALKFNDGYLERFRETVGRMRTFLIIPVCVVMSSTDTGALKHFSCNFVY